MSRLQPNQRKANSTNRLAPPIVLGLLAALALSSGCVVIEEDEVGVSKSFGNISDEPVAPGVALQVPGVRTVEVWTVGVQEIAESAQVVSSEGLIVALDLSLRFQVIPERAPEIRKTIGANYVERLLVPYLRNAVRDIVRGYPAMNIVSDAGREEIVSKIEAFLTHNLERRGIRVEDVLLHEVKLPPGFPESIEAKRGTEPQVR
jgi:regulator of protease activity HflC (stomatin/prohibitin superfamily)